MIRPPAASSLLAVAALAAAVTAAVHSAPAVAEKVKVFDADGTVKTVDIPRPGAAEAAVPKVFGPDGKPVFSGDPAYLAALEGRIARLEAKVAELATAGSTVKAPFTVVGAGGPVLRVTGEGLVLIGTTEESRITLSARPGAPPRLGVQSNEAVVQLVAGNGRAVIEALDANRSSASLVASAGQLGFTATRDNRPAAGLGSLPGKDVALRLYGRSGQQVAAAGENPATPGTGIVYVGNGKQNAAALAANADGSGVAHAFAADGTVGSGLIGGDRMVAAYNAAGAAVVTIGKSENSEGGNVTSRDPTGEGVFRAGFNSGVGGGDACVFRVKKQTTFCLGLGVPGMGTVGR